MSGNKEDIKKILNVEDLPETMQKLFRQRAKLLEKYATYTTLITGAHVRALSEGLKVVESIEDEEHKNEKRQKVLNSARANLEEENGNLNALIAQLDARVNYYHQLARKYEEEIESHITQAEVSSDDNADTTSSSLPPSRPPTPYSPMIWPEERASTTTTHTSMHTTQASFTPSSQSSMPTLGTMAEAAVSKTTRYGTFYRNQPPAGVTSDDVSPEFLTEEEQLELAMKLSLQETSNLQP